MKLEERVGALSVHDTTVGSKQATFKLKKVSINPKFKTVKINAVEVLSCPSDETAFLLRTAGGLLFLEGNGLFLGQLGRLASPFLLCTF